MATVTQWLDPIGARLFTTVNPPEMVQANGTNFPISGLAFDGAGASVEASYYEVPLPNYGVSNPSFTVLVDFYTPATTNATVFQAAVSVTTPGDAQSLLTDAFATANAASAVSSIATANAHLRATITITNLDSATANDRLTLKLFRDPANGGDSNTSDAIVFGIWFQYPDT
jgi:hypothetical protein